MTAAYYLQIAAVLSGAFDEGLAGENRGTLALDFE
jgi:hypothetical protein